MSMVIADLARNISSSAKIPFNPVKYAQEMSNELSKFKRVYKPTLDALSISLAALENSIGNFTVVTKNFKNRFDLADTLEFV